jgi:hypothetical protein
MIDHRRWPSVIVASLVSLDVLIAIGVGGPIRLLLTLWLLLICTGMAFVPLLELASLSTELLLGVAASIAFSAVVATAAVVIGFHFATSGLIVLETVTLIGCALQVRAMATGPRRAPACGAAQPLRIRRGK